MFSDEVTLFPPGKQRSLPLQKETLHRFVGTQLVFCFLQKQTLQRFLVLSFVYFFSATRAISLQ